MQRLEPVLFQLRSGQALARTCHRSSSWSTGGDSIDPGSPVGRSPSPDLSIPLPCNKTRNRPCAGKGKRKGIVCVGGGPSLRGMSPWGIHPPKHFILFLTGLPFYVPYPTLQDWEQFRGTGHIYSEFEINSPYHGNLSTHENFYSALSLSLNARRALSRTSPFSEA